MNEEEIKQPVLETDRLILRPYRESDLNDIFSYASNPEVTRYLLWDAHKTIEDSKEFFEWIQSVTSREKGKVFFVFAIELKESGKVIGSIDFKNTNKFGGQMDYVIGQPHWGKGYMSEAAAALKLWAFDNFPEIVRLQAYCQPENIGSKRVMEKIGMEYEGLRRKSFVVRNELVDLVHYALVR
ncbi:MAG: GNAT family N-acetyltransferase [Bdellovibrionales bacterium]|nr:GNAT family N-acetyltransferase [Bdellovibrionales bacterium]